MFSNISKTREEVIARFGSPKNSCLKYLELPETVTKQILCECVIDAVTKFHGNKETFETILNSEEEYIIYDICTGCSILGVALESAGYLNNFPNIKSKMESKGGLWRQPFSLRDIFYYLEE